MITDGVLTQEDAEKYFPELVESEDERIRKWIINEIKIKYHNLDGDNVDIVDKAIAYLEKQGEKRSKLVEFDLNANDSDLQEATYFIPNGFHAEIDGDKVVIKKGEQKSVKVPKFKVGNVIQFNGMGHTRYTIKEVCGLSHYINTCDRRMDMSYTDANFELVEQNTAWNDEDELQARQIERIVHNGCTPKLQKQIADWFLSLKDRVQPQSTWKPSDEQMKTLREAAVYVECRLDYNSGRALESLYDDLLKLKNIKL